MKFVDKLATKTRLSQVSDKKNSKLVRLPNTTALKTILTLEHCCEKKRSASLSGYLMWMDSGKSGK